MTDSLTQSIPERPTTTRTNAAATRLDDLPAPRGLPVLGNLLQLDPKQLHTQLEAWNRELGPAYNAAP